MRAADGTWHWFESNANDLRDNPDVRAVLVSTRDVTERVKLTEALAHAAGHDPLTDLPNRGLFGEQLAASLARAQRADRRVTLCFVDLDRLKPVNDERGHHVGDEVLCSVADRLRGLVRTGDVAARVGGDEFVLLLEPTTDEVEVEVTSVVGRVVDALSQPHATSAGSIECGASIGVARSRSGEGAETLLRRADAALYEAKAAGRGGVVHAVEPEETSPQSTGRRPAPGDGDQPAPQPPP